MIGIGQGLRLLLLILARRDIHEKSHAPRTAMRRRARRQWRHSPRAGGVNDPTSAPAMRRAASSAGPPAMLTALVAQWRDSTGVSTVRVRG